MKPSKNQFGADNQQEKQVGWIVGFVDGEGTFSVSINKNTTTSSGWQIFPEFVITQGAKSLPALEEIKNFFDCGKLYINRRTDNHREHLYRFCVRMIKDLEEKIVPFFRANPLRTAKQEDFIKFARILALMKQGKHLTPKGVEQIAKIIETMNRKKPSRYLLSSETIRQESRHGGIKIQSELHSDMQSATEMIAPANILRATEKSEIPRRLGPSFLIKLETMENSAVCGNIWLSLRYSITRSVKILKIQTIRRKDLLQRADLSARAHKWARYRRILNDYTRNPAPKLVLE